MYSSTCNNSQVCLLSGVNLRDSQTLQTSSNQGNGIAILKACRTGDSKLLCEEISKDPDAIHDIHLLLQDAGFQQVIIS
jgi:fructose-1-phosphate kinase PfkB-like protein